METDRYMSIAARSEGLYKEKGSRFIAFAMPVSSESQVKEIISAMRKEYYDARHCCYAYRIGLEGRIFRSSDDGEPSGTGGRPILGQIDSAGLSDILIAVVRYFGGIKLGVPGLINAYRTAAADAIANAEKIEKTATQAFTIAFDYISMNEVMKVVKDMSLPVVSQDFSEKCLLHTLVPLCSVESFKSRFALSDNISISES